MNLPPPAVVGCAEPARVARCRGMQSGVVAAVVFLVLPLSAMDRAEEGGRLPLDSTLRAIAAGSTYRSSPIVGRMRFVRRTAPSGFLQGSPLSEPCRSTDERQFHHVLTRDFAVMETEITRRMWEDLRQLQPSLPRDPTDAEAGGGAANPVQNVTWNEAALFANLLSSLEGHEPCYYTCSVPMRPIDASNYLSGPCRCEFSASGYRLPTEGEWEYMARAGSVAAFSIEEPGYLERSCSSCEQPLNLLQTVAVFCENADPGALPAGERPPNRWNLRDLHGNVEEWCWDWFQPTYPSGVAVDYTGPESGTLRVTRGGSWLWPARACRSASRLSARPSLRGPASIGFRLVQTAPERR